MENRQSPNQNDTKDGRATTAVLEGGNACFIDQRSFRPGSGSERRFGLWVWQDFVFRGAIVGSVQGCPMLSPSATLVSSLRAREGEPQETTGSVPCAAN